MFRRIPGLRRGRAGRVRSVSLGRGERARELRSVPHSTRARAQVKTNFTQSCNAQMHSGLLQVIVPLEVRVIVRSPFRAKHHVVVQYIW